MRLDTVFGSIVRAKSLRSVLKPQQPTLGRIRPERSPREAWQPSHVPTRRRAGQCDEPWTLPSRGVSLLGSRSHLHGAKCVQKQRTAATPSRNALLGAGPNREHGTAVNPPPGTRLLARDPGWGRKGPKAASCVWRLLKTCKIAFAVLQ